MNALSDESAELLLPYITGHRTAVLVPPSGAGKSTLINALLGEQRQATCEVRVGDGRGRHATVARESSRCRSAACSSICWACERSASPGRRRASPPSSPTSSWPPSTAASATARTPTSPTAPFELPSSRHAAARAFGQLPQAVARGAGDGDQDGRASAHPGGSDVEISRQGGQELPQTNRSLMSGQVGRFDLATCMLPQGDDAMTTRQTVLLVGGTGRTGGRVLEQLLSRGASVRVIVRSARQAPGGRGGESQPDGGRGRPARLERRALAAPRARLRRRHLVPRSRCQPQGRVWAAARRWSRGLQRGCAERSKRCSLHSRSSTSS